MNILFASTADHFGGTERWASLAVAEMERRGHRVWMACPDLPHAARFIRTENLYHDGPTSLWDVNGRNRLARFCRDHAIDIVIPISQRLFFTCGQMARKLGIGSVVRLGIVRLPLRPIVDWYGYGIYPDAILVNSKRIKRILCWAPFVERDRIRVIYNGISDAPAEVADRDPDVFTIASVGTISWRKGMGHLIRAVARLPHTERARVRLKLVGTGPALERYSELAVRLGIGDQVTFTGDVDNPAAHVAASDLFVLLSAQEGISNAVLEAMSVGTPVLTTLVGGHGEFIHGGENAFVAGTRSPSAVARDLSGIMSNPALADVGRAGRETVRSMFSMTAMGDQLEELLTCIVRSRRDASARRP